MLMLKSNFQNKIRIFGFKKKFNSIIRPNKKLDRKLNFEIRLFNAKVKILDEYYVRIFSSSIMRK